MRSGLSKKGLRAADMRILQVRAVEDWGFRAWSRSQNPAKRSWLGASPQTVHQHGKAAQQRQEGFLSGS
jgi:hypothetical protein